MTATNGLNTQGPQFAIVDVENLIIDVVALVLALCRSKAKTKVPPSILGKFEGYSCRMAIQSVLASLSSDDKSFADLIDDIESDLHHHCNLIRPRFGAAAFLRYLAKELKYQVVFVTVNPKLIIAALQPKQSNISLIHFANPHWSFATDEMYQMCATSNNNRTINFQVASRLISKCSKEPLYVVGEKNILEKLPSVDHLLSSHALFFKSAYLLTTFVQSAHSSLSSTFELHNIPFLALSKSYSSTTPLPWSQSLPTSLDDINWFHFINQLPIPCTPSVKHPDTFLYPFKVSPLEIMSSPICPERLLWNTFQHVWPITVFEGKVIDGFGRGSRDLGIPTSNLDCNTPIEGDPLPFPGIYFGVATMWETSWNRQPVDCFDMVMSVGYNPYYDNSELTIEPYIFQYFANNFRGARLRVVGLLRAEANFERFEHLIQAIQNDCEAARMLLDDLRKYHAEEFQKYKQKLKLIDKLDSSFNSESTYSSNSGGNE